MVELSVGRGGRVTWKRMAEWICIRAKVYILCVYVCVCRKIKGWHSEV